MSNKRKKLTLIVLLTTILLVTLFFVTYAKDKDQRLTVLLYHHILEEKDNTSGNASIIDAELFEEHIKYLSEHGYTCITLKQLENHLYHHAELPDKSIMITFDDGYLSNYEYAYPILKKYNFKAVLFPTTINITKKPVEFTSKGLPRWSFDHFVEASDVFEYGSHSHDLHLKDEQMVPYILAKDKQYVRHDLDKSRFMLGNTTAFAYPFGYYDDSSIENLKESGYRLAFTVEEDKVTPNTKPFEIPRYGVFPWTSIQNLEYILRK